MCSKQEKNRLVEGRAGYTHLPDLVLTDLKYRCSRTESSCGESPLTMNHWSSINKKTKTKKELGEQWPK